MISTADLVDSYADEVRSCQLQFHRYGQRRRFCGPIATVLCLLVLVGVADAALTDPELFLSSVTAIEGEYNREAQLLLMKGGVNLFHDMGYEFQTESANLDLVQGEAFGNEPVFGQGPFGYLEAKGFRIINRGERVILTGQSKVIIYSLNNEPTE